MLGSCPHKQPDAMSVGVLSETKKYVNGERRTRWLKIGREEGQRRFGLGVDDRGGDLQAWRGVEHLPYHKIGNGVSYADPALSA